MHNLIFKNEMRNISEALLYRQEGFYEKVKDKTTTDISMTF